MHVLHVTSKANYHRNLVNANHIIFVSPLLANNQYKYDSSMAQAIARCRRYQQEKKVFIYHFAAIRTIDVDILEHRHKRFDAIGEREIMIAGRSGSRKGERTKMVRTATAAVSLVPISWLFDEKLRDSLGIDGDVTKNFGSLISFSDAFENNEE